MKRLAPAALLSLIALVALSVGALHAQTLRTVTPVYEDDVRLDGTPELTSWDVTPGHMYEVSVKPHADAGPAPYDAALRGTAILLQAGDDWADRRQSEFYEVVKTGSSGTEVYVEAPRFWFIAHEDEFGLTPRAYVFLEPILGAGTVAVDVYDLGAVELEWTGHEPWEHVDLEE
jgi:hypothetical protein